MYRIAMVVDERFGSKVLDLAQTVYVWIIESAENDRWAKLAWEAPQRCDDPLLCGVSTFKREPEEKLDALIVRVLDMIDEHHGEFAHDPEWSEIDVYGACTSTEIEAAAADYGVNRCESAPFGFRLCRPDPNSASVDRVEA
ncbi:MAG TPA: hypothetical protein VIV60_19535 [Polyangiaceae bacterium]